VARPARNLNYFSDVLPLLIHARTTSTGVLHWLDRARSKISFRKVHVLVHEAPKKAANTREPPPNAALPLTYTVGQPHDAAGRQRRQLIDDVSPMGSLPLRISCPLTCDSSHSASSTRRPRAQPLVRTTWGNRCAVAATASRGASSGKQPLPTRPPASLRPGAAARSYGAPDTGDLRGPRPPRAARYRAGIRLRTHPSEKAACGC
jgi:hypothetical protein